MHATHFSCSLILAVCAACAGDEPSLVEKAEPLPVPSEVSNARPVAVIGRAEGPEDDFIHPIPVGTATDGELFVFGVRTRELRKFSREGEFQTLISSRGSGPGEIRTPSVSMLVDSSGVHMWDGRIGTLSTFTHGGRLLSSGRLGNAPIGGDGSTIVARRGETDVLLLVRKTPRPDGDVARGTTHFSIQSIPQAAGEAHTLFEYDVPAATLKLSQGRSSVSVQHVQTGLTVGYDAVRDEWVRVERPAPRSATEAVFSIERLTADGETRLKKTFAVPTERVPSSVVDSLMEQIKAVGRLAGGDMYKDLDRRVVAEAVQWPEFYPAVGRLVIGGDGAIWLMRPMAPDAEGQEWLVFDHQLELRARVRLPSTVMYPIFRGRSIWGTQMTEEPVVARFDW